MHVVEHAITAACTPKELAALLKEPLRKKSAHAFGPPAETSRVVYFIDDVSMGSGGDVESVGGVGGVGGIGGVGGVGGGVSHSGGSQAAVLRHLLANQRIYMGSGQPSPKSVDGASHVSTTSTTAAEVNN